MIAEPPSDFTRETTEANLISCLLIEASSSANLIQCHAAGITTRTFKNRVHADIFSRIEDYNAQGISEGVVGELIRLIPENALTILNLSGVDAVQTSTHIGAYIRDLKLIEGQSDLMAIAARFTEAAKAPNIDPAEVLREHQAFIADLATPPMRLFALSAAELCLTPPPTPAPIIHGMLFRGGTMMLSAPSKGHKTYTGLDLAVAVATGRDWLGLKTTATAVLYVNLELPPFAAAQRLNAICGAHGIKPPADLFILNLRGRRVTVDTLAREIMPYAKAKNAGLVVIDPYYKLASVSGVEENSNDGQAIFLADLEAAATAGECAIFLLHHFAKGDSGSKNSIDRASGGGVLARWPDVIGTLTEHETEECMVAEFHLRVYAPIPRFVVRWCCPVWVREAAEDASRIKKRAGATVKYHTADLVPKLTNGMTSSEWERESGWSHATFTRSRDELISTGKVTFMMGIYNHANG